MDNPSSSFYGYLGNNGSSFLEELGSNQGGISSLQQHQHSPHQSMVMAQQAMLNHQQSGGQSNMGSYHPHSHSYMAVPSTTILPNPGNYPMQHHLPHPQQHSHSHIQNQIPQGYYDTAYNKVTPSHHPMNINSQQPRPTTPMWPNSYHQNNTTTPPSQSQTASQQQSSCSGSAPSGYTNNTSNQWTQSHYPSQSQQQNVMPFVPGTHVLQSYSAVSSGGGLSPAAQSSYGLYQGTASSATTNEMSSNMCNSNIPGYNMPNVQTMSSSSIPTNAYRVMPPNLTSSNSNNNTSPLSSAYPGQSPGTMVGVQRHMHQLSVSAPLPLQPMCHSYTNSSMSTSYYGSGPQMGSQQILPEPVNMSTPSPLQKLSSLTSQIPVTSSSDCLNVSNVQVCVDVSASAMTKEFDFEFQQCLFNDGNDPSLALSSTAQTVTSPVSSTAAPSPPNLPIFTERRTLHASPPSSLPLSLHNQTCELLHSPQGVHSHVSLAEDALGDRLRVAQSETMESHGSGFVSSCDVAQDDSGLNTPPAEMDLNESTIMDNSCASSMTVVCGREYQRLPFSTPPDLVAVYSHHSTPNVSPSIQDILPSEETIDVPIQHEVSESNYPLLSSSPLPIKKQIQENNIKEKKPKARKRPRSTLENNGDLSLPGLALKKPRYGRKRVSIQSSVQQEMDMSSIDNESNLILNETDETLENGTTISDIVSEVLENQSINEEDSPAPCPTKAAKGTTLKSRGAVRKRTADSQVRQRRTKGRRGSTSASYYGEGGDSDYESRALLNRPIYQTEGILNAASDVVKQAPSSATSDSETVAAALACIPESITEELNKKRRSSRAAATNKKYNIDAALAFSGDELEDLEEIKEDFSSFQPNLSAPISRRQNDTVVSTIQSEEVVEIKQKIVEKILGRRMGKRPVMRHFTSAPDSGEPEKDSEKTVTNEDDEEEEEVEEFYVKYKGYSYLHCEWKTLDELEDPRILAKVKRFRAKVSHRYEEDEPEDLFNPDYVEVDRVLDVRILQEPMENSVNSEDDQVDEKDPDTNMSIDEFSNTESTVYSKKFNRRGSTTYVDVTYYLVKWRTLPYEEATWELAQDVDPLKVKEFLRWRDPEEVASTLRNQRIYPLGERPNPSEWNAAEVTRRVSESSTYRNNNHLRPYQIEGVTWLTFCWYQQRNCILADEMGLGKTVQSIAFLVEVFSTGVRGPFLILVPLSTLGNWQREFDNWADMNVLVYHGSATSRQMIQNYDMFYGSSGPPPWNVSANGRRTLAQMLRWTEQCKFHALITTYEVLMNDIEFFSRFLWRAAIIDEAHRLKNNKCKLHEGLSCLDLEHRVLLTGTPLQNSTQELFSLLHFLNPEKFPSVDAFMEEFGDLKTEDQVGKLQALLKPMMLRRLKEDVEKSIAPKEETIIEVELTNIQKRYYRAILERNYKYLCKGSSHSNAPNLINTMMELRKCCNHPYLTRHAEENIMSEMQELQQQLQQERLEQQRLEKERADNATSVKEKEILTVSADSTDAKKDDEAVNEEYVKPDSPSVFTTQQQSMSPSETVTVTSSTSSLSQSIIDMNYQQLQLHTLIYSSGKLVLVHKLLPRLKQEGHKVLIFSQMTRVLDILEDYLVSQKLSYERLDGGITGEKRQEAIDRFCTDASKFIFILCTKAGGLGINLTAADVVIIFDSDWNPQNDLQAQARCHRIGQSKMVKVYRLITRNTYEREMFDRASMKLGLDKAVLQSLGNKETKKSQPSKKEVEDLLKKGAYGALMEDDQAGEDFCEEDIDNILQRRSHVVNLESNGAGGSGSVSSTVLGQSTFSKASFSVSDNRNDIDIDDPNFWSKWAHKAGLDEQAMLAHEKLIMDEPRQRRQTNRYVADSGYDYSENNAANGAPGGSTDFTGAGERGTGTTDRAGNLYGGRSDDDSSGDEMRALGEDGAMGGGISAGSGLLFSGGPMDSDGDVRIHALTQEGAIIDGEIVDRADMFKLEKGLLTWGWGRWDKILQHTSLKCSNFITQNHVERLCITVVHYALRHYNGDALIADFVSTLLRGDTAADAVGTHLGLSAPVARGRRGRMTGGVLNTTGASEGMLQDLEDVGEGHEIQHLPPAPENVQLMSDNFKKHLRRNSNRLLHRIQNLCFLRQKVLGVYSDKIAEGAPSTECRLLHSDVTENAAMNVFYRRLDNMERPVDWWNREADECLLLGVHKHGCEKYEAMRADPKLCFLHKCGPPPHFVQTQQDNATVPEMGQEELGEDVASEKDEPHENLDTTVRNETEKESSVDKSKEGNQVDEKAIADVGGLLKNDLLIAVNEEPLQYLPFPAATELNSRYRRLIAFFQRTKVHEGVEQQKVKRGSTMNVVKPPKPLTTIDPNWLSPRDMKWSRREEADFYRVVSIFGVERMANSNGKFTSGEGYYSPGSLYAWENFRNYSAITKKSDAALTAYYEAFRYMCRLVTNRLDPEEHPPNDVKVSPISSERAAKCLHKIDLLCRIREEALCHPQLEERLHLCQRSPDLPEWWIPVIHDRDLLRGVAKHGLGHCETSILRDPDLSFSSTLRLLEKRVQCDKDIHEKIINYGIGSCANSLAAAVALELQQDYLKAAVKVAKLQEELNELEQMSGQLDTIIESETKMEVEILNKSVTESGTPSKDMTSSDLPSQVDMSSLPQEEPEVSQVIETKVECASELGSELEKSPKEPADKVTESAVPLTVSEEVSQMTLPSHISMETKSGAVQSTSEECAASDMDGKESLQDGDKSVKDSDQGNEKMNVEESVNTALFEESGVAIWPRNAEEAALINCALSWPKDRTLMNRIEAVLHCIMNGEWPYSRRYQGMTNPSNLSSSATMAQRLGNLTPTEASSLSHMMTESTFSTPQPQTTSMNCVSIPSTDIPHCQFFESDKQVQLQQTKQTAANPLSSGINVSSLSSSIPTYTSVANTSITSGGLSPLDMSASSTTPASAAADAMSQYLAGLNNVVAAMASNTPSTSSSNNNLSGQSSVEQFMAQLIEQQQQMMQAMGIDATNTSGSTPTVTSSNVVTPVKNPTSIGGSTFSGRGRGRGRGGGRGGGSTRATPQTNLDVNVTPSSSVKASSNFPTTSSINSAPSKANESTPNEADVVSMLLQYMAAAASSGKGPTSMDDEQQMLLLSSLLASAAAQQSSAVPSTPMLQSPTVTDPTDRHSTYAAAVTPTQKVPSRRGRKRKNNKGMPPLMDAPKGFPATSQANSNGGESGPSSSALAAMLSGNQQMEAWFSALSNMGVSLTNESGESPSNATPKSSQANAGLHVSQSPSALTINTPNPSSGKVSKGSTPKRPQSSVLNSPSSSSKLCQSSPSTLTTPLPQTSTSTTGAATSGGGSRSSTGKKDEKWDITVPVMHLATTTLIDAPGQAPTRRYLEQWLHEHPDYVPYSVQTEDQEIWNRVAQSRGHTNADMYNLAEIVQYHHYMSMMQSALASASQYTAAAAAAALSDNVLTPELQQQQQAATALVMNQLLAQMMLQQQAAVDGVMDNVDSNTAAALANIYAAANLNQMMAAFSGGNPPATTAAPTAGSELFPTSTEAQSATTANVSSTRNAVSVSANNQPTVTPASRSTSNATTSSISGSMGGQENSTTTNKPVSKVRSSSSSRIKSPHVSTTVGPSTLPTSTVSPSPATSSSNTKSRQSQKRSAPGTSGPSVPNSSVLSVPTQAGEMPESKNESMSEEEYAQLMATYQMMYAMAYSNAANPFMYAQMMAAAAATSGMDAPAAGSESSAVPGNAATEQLLRDFASYQEAARGFTSPPSPSVSRSLIAEDPATLGTSSTASSGNGAQSSNSSVLDLSSKRTS